MGYSEFPHTHYADNADMGDFIRLYTDLSDKYGGTLAKINSLEERLSKYEADMNGKINQLKTVDMPSIARAELEKTITPYVAELNAVKSEVMMLTARANGHDTLLENMQAQITALSNRINAVREELLAQMAEGDASVRQECKEYADEKLVGFEAQVEECKDFTERNVAFVMSQINKDRAEVISRDVAVEERAENYTDEQVRRVRQEIESLETASSNRKAIEWLWNECCNVGGYTAGEWFNDTAIKSSTWQDSKISAVTYYTRGKTVFLWYDRRGYIFSPFTGLPSSPQTVIGEICDYLKISKGLTSYGFDSMQIKAGVYDDRQIKAYDYDWNGKEILANA